MDPQWGEESSKLSVSVMLDGASKSFFFSPSVTAENAREEVCIPSFLHLCRRPSHPLLPFTHPQIVNDPDLPRLEAEWDEYGFFTLPGNKWIAQGPLGSNELDRTGEPYW